VKGCQPVKDVSFYLSRGFDRRTAEYYAAGRRRILSVCALPAYTLRLTFDNGETRTLDCRPYLLPGTVFDPLLAADVFSRVYLDETGCPAWDIDPAVDSAVVWSNKVDLGADTCYLDSTPAHRS